MWWNMNEIEIDIRDISTEVNLHLCLCEERDCVINNIKFDFVINSKQVQDIIKFLDDNEVMWCIEYNISDTSFSAIVDDLTHSFRLMVNEGAVNFTLEFGLDSREDVFKLLDGKDKKPDEQKLKIKKVRGKYGK